jgi:hypothetical protein
MKVTLSIIFCVIFCIIAAVQGQKDEAYLQRINSCFTQLFEPNVTCQQWSEGNFLQSGQWYHPNLPKGARGWAQIADFCTSTREQYAQSAYLPTVIPKLTHSGEYAYASVDYVFASNQPTVPAVNWGNVFFALANNSNHILIHSAVETWAQRQWPNQLSY